MKKLFKSCIILLTLVAGFNAYALSDIQGHLYEDAIQYTKQAGVIKGYEDNTFRPDNEVNRAELAKIIIGTRFAHEVYSKQYDTECFTDVQQGAWYTLYICLGKEKGVIAGYADGTFRPEQAVNFVEGLKIISEAFGRTPIKETEEWFRPYVEDAAKDNLLALDITSFDMFLTRGQVAEMTTRFFLFDVGKKKALETFVGKRWEQQTTYDGIKKGITPVLLVDISSTKMEDITDAQKEVDTAEMYQVVRVVDGDTLLVDMNGVNERVRIIGIDTPETVHPDKSVECFGKEASAYAKNLMETKNVKLLSDTSQSDRDVYKRLLRYVYLENGTDVGLTMIREGYANEYTYRIPYEQQKQYKEAEVSAKEQGKGLWAENACLKETKEVESMVPVIQVFPVEKVPQEVKKEEPVLNGGVVKLSKSGICHAPGTRYYNQTKNYTSFTSLDACLQTGGRLPK